MAISERNLASWRLLWRVTFHPALQSGMGTPYSMYRLSAEQSGRFALVCQAHVQTLIPNIDEPEYEVVLSHVLELTCTHA